MGKLSVKMADASPNSAKDLEIVEIVEDSTKDLEIVEDGRETGNEGEKSNGDGRDGEEGIVRKDREEDETTDCDGEDGVVKKNPEEDETIENHGEETEASKSDKGSEKGANDDESLKVCTSAKDTRSIRSRVFVGHLNTNNATRHDLERLFSSCGKIEAISMLHGYGFVQFDNEESARKAIEDVHGTPFMGMKLGTIHWCYTCICGQGGMLGDGSFHRCENADCTINLIVCSHSR